MMCKVPAELLRPGDPRLSLSQGSLCPRDGKMTACGADAEGDADVRLIKNKPMRIRSSTPRPI